MLRCDGEHRVRRSWHFAEDCQVERVRNGLKVTSGLAQVLFEPLEELDGLQLIRGGSAEQGGWVSRSFGCKQPSTSAHWYSRVTGHTVLRTRITYTRSREIGL
jgi:hypothetical protein